MKFELKMAWRFLKSGKTQTFLILLGIVIGVAVQTFLGSLITGLQKDLVNQTVGNSPHITILGEDERPRPIVTNSDDMSRIITYSGGEEGINRWREKLETLDNNSELTAVSPVVEGSGFALRGSNNQSVLFRGVDLERADKIYNIKNRIVSGEENISGNSILIGIELANELELEAGDFMQVRSADGITDRFVVNGIFDLESGELNKSWVLMNQQRASTFLGKENEISSYELQVNDVFSADKIAENLNNEIEGIKVENWQKNNEQLLTALQSQSSSSIVIQVFVIIAVTLGIASVLAVSVVQKSRQIGILKAMGATNRSVAIVFLLQGAILGIFGSILGSLSGIGLSQLFVNLIRTADGDPLFPVEISLSFIMLSILIATSAGMIAALIPARNSAKLSPMEVIRNA
ncbi:MAG: ABC transporter permease [Bacillota bacterium]